VHRFTFTKQSFTRGCSRFAFQYLSHNFNEIPESVADSEFQFSINNGSALSMGGCGECMRRRQYFIFPLHGLGTRSKRRLLKKRKYSETENSTCGEVYGCRWKFPEDNRNFSLKAACASRTRVLCVQTREKIRNLSSNIYIKNTSKNKIKIENRNPFRINCAT